MSDRSSSKYLSYFSILSLLSLLHCSDSSLTVSSAVEQVTLSGQVAVRTADIAASISTPQNVKGLSKLVSPKFATVGDAVLGNATVTLIKILADGTEEEMATTTTDSSGNYSLAEVDICQAGTGASDDYYYELRVVSGDVTVRSAVCPTADSATVTADVSPESTIAADIIAEVADPQSLTTNPLPAANEFAELNNLVASNIDEIQDNIEIPSLDDADSLVALANGMASAGGDAENSYKAYQFEAEYVGLTASADTTTNNLSGYLVRMAREACDQPSSPPIHEAAAQALAQALDAGTTYTPADVVDAYNEALDTPTATLADVVSNYASQLEALESTQDPTNLSALIKKVEFIDDDSLVASFTQHDLTADTLTSSTELSADQALSLMLSIPATPCNFTNDFDMTAAMANLTADETLAEPAISEVEIYNDSGFNCNGAGQGHFIGNVNIYIPDGSALTVTGVVITSTDATSLGGDGSVTLTSSGGRYVSLVDPNAAPNPGDCVTIDQEVTYTITATLSDASTITQEVTRTHPAVPEADASLSGAALSGDQNAPTLVDVLRPTFTWDAPADVLADIPTAPDGTQIKYTYEYAHFKVGDMGPLANSASCPQISFGPLYSVDNFIPTVDCKVDDCATAQGTTSDQIMCRLSVQTYLVDETDDVLAKAAGDFKFFCVDTNGDDDCGE